MTDIALVKQQDIGDAFDLSMDGRDLATDAGLETAIIVSLFSDARASDAELPDGHTDRRGWWGDVVDPADETGSRLWTLEREKSLNAVAVRAEEYAREALQWLRDDGVVSELTVTAELLDRQTVAIRIQLYRERGAGDELDLQYSFNWQTQIAETA